MALIYKLIPHLLAWAGIVIILLRGCPGRRTVVMITSAVGFIIGVGGAFFLFRSISGELSFGIIRTLLGGGLILLWCVSVVAIYRSSGRGEVSVWGNRLIQSAPYAGVVSALSGLTAGAVSASMFPGATGTALLLVSLALAGVALAYAALILEKLLPATIKISAVATLATVIAFLLLSASSILRLDLFAPLSMKVMKGVHDFVHQFMESILIPDHLFVRPVIWKYIGFLFGKEVGFWGGMIIWFTPAVLIVLAIYYERLPSVAHIRQGAQRRKLLAAAIREQRYRLVMPSLAVVIFAAAAYQSSFPSVEYWDPKPLPITAGPSGEIFIPKKGEVNLEDGRLHKYLFKQGGQEVRFFVLKGAAGLTVDLDACAICKPDGYGQAEGTVYCYYCKTLIPIETVGKPGGCNPVPVQFTEKADGVVIDGLTLVNSWRSTIQATTGVKGGGK